MQPQNFFIKNRVFIFGLLSSLSLTLQQLISSNTTDVKVLSYAAMMAILSYIANQWRGKGVTILGIVGTMASTFITIQQTGNFTWQQFIFSALAAVLAAVAPPPKADTYEHNEVIVQAKEIPPVNQINDTDIRTTPKSGVK